MVDEPRDPFEERPAGKGEPPTPLFAPSPVADLPAWKKPGWLPSVENLVIEATKRFANRFRFVRVLGQWFVYDSGVWSWDERDAVTSELGAMCREVGAVHKRSARMKLESGGIVQTIERRLRAELAATSEQWDADLFLVNVPWRVPTGPRPAIVPQRPEDYCTKQTTVAPERIATPLWDAHLAFVTGGDDELASYLQRAAGYSASGETIEQCLFVLYGTGGNGKGVFLRTIAGVLGGYATTTPIETITASRHDRHPEELARLRGVRLVMSSESAVGHVWNEARIKLMTGGDRIVARFMRENSFEFTPQFKLWLMTNNKPQLRSVDPAIARRLHMIPFTQSIGAAVNVNFEHELKAEWPGILSWVLDGLELWKDAGLRPPQAVLAATADYLADEDLVGEWISEELDELPTAETRSAELFAAWKKWAEARGEYVGSNKWLAAKLETKGFRKRHSRDGACYRGLALRAYRENQGPDRFM